MNQLRDQNGSVLVFITLMIVLLLVMVGLGLDTGQLAYTRGTAQPALDAAALAAASGIPTGSEIEVRNRATFFNSTNTFTGSATTAIAQANVTLMKFTLANPADSTNKNYTLAQAASIATANAARVALETNNPYDAGATNTPIKSPLFLTPLFNLLGASTQGTQNVSVSAVAVSTGMVGLPMAVEQARCAGPNPTKLLQSSSSEENKGKAFNDTSGYTTYWINATNPGTIQEFLRVSDDCSGGLAALSGAGFCTNLNNGAIVSVYDDFENLFRANPGKCFLIPVVPNGSDWQRCQNIMYFGTWCPDPSTPTVKNGNDRYLLGNLTCPTDPTAATNLKCYTQVLVRDKASGM